MDRHACPPSPPAGWSTFIGPDRHEARAAGNCCPAWVPEDLEKRGKVLEKPDRGRGRSRADDAIPRQDGGQRREFAWYAERFEHEGRSNSLAVRGFCA